MRIKPLNRGFVTSKRRVLTKAMCTRFVERELPREHITKFAYQFDPSIAEIDTYNPKETRGRSNLYARFDRWKYKGSEGESYRHLDGNGPDYITMLAECQYQDFLDGKEVYQTDEDLEVLYELLVRATTATKQPSDACTGDEDELISA